MYRFISALLVLVVATGCNTVPVSRGGSNNTSSQEVSAQDYFSAANYHFELFEKNYMKRDIELAALYSKRALDAHPENIKVQNQYYTILFTREVFLDEPSDELIKAYQLLNPALKQNKNPPSYVEFIKLSLDKESTLQEKITGIKTVIRDQPYIGRNWQLLSQFYAEQDRMWLSYSAAQQAVRVMPEEPSYLNTAGLAYNDLIQSRACIYDEIDASKKAMSYLAKAASIDPKPEYLYAASVQQMHLGMAPLALVSIKKAYKEISEDKDALWNFIEVSILNNDYSTVYDKSKELVQKHNVIRGYEYAALSLFRDGDMSKAAGFIKKLNVDGEPLSTLDELRIRFISALAGVEYSQAELEETQTYSNWEQIIKEHFMSRERGYIATGDLIAQAETSCELVEAHFYTAFEYYLQGDLAKSNYHIKKTSETKAYYYLEYMWAKLLDTGLSG